MFHSEWKRRCLVSEAQADRLSKRLDDANSEITQLEAQLKAAREEVAELNAELAAPQGHALVKENARLAGEVERLRGVDAEVVEERKRYADLMLDLASALNTDRIGTRAVLLDEVKALRARLAALTPNPPEPFDVDDDDLPLWLEMAADDNLAFGRSVGTKNTLMSRARQRIEALESSLDALRWRPMSEVEFEDDGIFTGVALVRVVIDRDRPFGESPMVLCRSNCEEIPIANVIGVLPTWREGGE